MKSDDGPARGAAASKDVVRGVDRWFARRCSDRGSRGEVKGREVRCITPAEPVTGPVPRRGCTRRREQPANLTSARTRPTRRRYPTAVRPQPRSRTRTHARPADMMAGATTSVIAGPLTRRTPILRYVASSNRRVVVDDQKDSRNLIGIAKFFVLASSIPSSSLTSYCRVEIKFNFGLEREREGREGESAFFFDRAG